MSLKWLGLSNWCKHREYEDTCHLCKQDLLLDKLLTLYNAATLFVNHVPPENCTADMWFEEIDKFATIRHELELKLIEAVEGVSLLDNEAANKSARDLTVNTETAQ